MFSNFPLNGRISRTLNRRFFSTQQLAKHAREISRVHVTQDDSKHNSETVLVTWKDGVQSRFPAIYLRDNCLELKNNNGQKLAQTCWISQEEVSVNDCLFEDKTKELKVNWGCGRLVSTFSEKWLFDNSCASEHREERRSNDSAELNNNAWNSNFTPAIFDYQRLQECSVLIAEQIDKDGVCILKNGPTEESYDENKDPPVVQVANTLGCVLQTVWNRYFDVKTKSGGDANDVAYTSGTLSAHTDNPYRKQTPPAQLLHCLKQAATVNEKDGINQLVDGFRIALDIKKKYPHYYKLLSTIKRPFTHVDSEHGYIQHEHKYVIEVDEHQNPTQINFSNGVACSVGWDIDEKDIEDYYAAFQLFGKLTYSSEYVVEYLLQPGDVMIFDNQRVLHGRTGFVDQNGSRHLQGCYMDMDSVKAKLNASMLRNKFAR